MKSLSKLSLFFAAITIFLFANLVFTACKKDSLSQSVPAKQNVPEQSVPKLDLKSLVSIEDGVLTFKDCEDLKKVYEYLGNPKTPRDILSKTFVGFVSLNSAYEHISKVATQGDMQPNEYEGVAYWSGVGDGMSFERTIGNPFYTMIFNQEGLIKMDGNWIKHTQDEILIYSSEYSNIGLRKTIKPIQRISIESVVKERSSNCETVYATQNGNQWKKVTGNQGANYILSCANSICTIVLLGNFAIESKSRKRGFLGRWYAYDADIVGINGLGSDDDASSYSSIGVGGNTPFVTDAGATGTCNPFQLNKNYIQYR